MRIIYQYQKLLNDNLIVFNVDDKFVYLGAFSTNASKGISESTKDGIQKSIDFIVKNTEDCEIYISRTGDLMDSEYLANLKEKLK